MCFYNDDYDWIAEINEQTTQTANKPVKCDECGSTITPGEQYISIYQQEHEECVADDPESENEDYGETFDYDRCLNCDRVLQAIKAAELEAGCPPRASQPNLLELGEAMREDDGERYKAKAVQMFPGIEGHVRKLRWEEDE